MYPNFIYASEFDEQTNDCREQSNKHGEVDYRIHAAEWAIAKNPQHGSHIGKKNNQNFFTLTLAGFGDYEGFLVTYSEDSSTIEFVDLTKRENI